MKKVQLLAFALLFHSLLFASQVQKTGTPQWVNKINPNDQNLIEGAGGFQYFLIDLQENIKTQESYHHFTLKINNSDGIQSSSDISVNFDPKFQTLRFHQLKITRNGVDIDKLNDTNIQVIQRESSMERSLYDGSLTAVINLSDVRVGDIIEYAYSIKGYNPIYDGNFYQTFYHQSSIPVNRIYNRILTSNPNFRYKLLQNAQAPSESKFNGLKEYIWDVNAIEQKLIDNNVPAWYDPYKRVNVSTYKNWSDIIDILLPNYEFSKKGLDKIQQEIDVTGSNDELKVLMAIRFVQDEIRYLGFEGGISAYKPNDPIKVFEQKYGDCKDKSLLLASILQNIGIEAYPMLVNTVLRGEIDKYLPGIPVFDHCIVYFKDSEGQEYFIDPTISNQGGSIKNIFTPPYGDGLLIKQGTESLIEFPFTEPSTVKINEMISSNSFDSPAQLFVRTEYSGSKADFIRSYFSSNSVESITKEYLNFYSTIYPDIQSSDVVKLYDYDRNTTNNLIVEEYYEIANPWQSFEDSNTKYFEIYPLVIDAQINYAQSASRDMPYYLGDPYFLQQKTTIDLPEIWNIQTYEKSIEGEGFEYSNIVEGLGKSVTATHIYSVNKEYIEGEMVGDLMRKHNDIRNQLSYQLSYSGTSGTSVLGLSWLSIILGGLGIVIGVVLVIKINKIYDPEPWIYAENKSISGWLILPAIGIVLTPFIIGWELISTGFFTEVMWSNIDNGMFQNKAMLTLIISGEIIINCLFLVYSIFILILFFQRRTNIPRLISIFYIVNLVLPVIDTLLLTTFVPEIQSNPSDWGQVARGVVSAAIWIPYFNISERAKSTFCKQKKENHL